ncbi:mediator of RNA polymerase II transcription subunit 15-like [Haliotis asinina]|uniref:mediator of RNA polymerase II transcription subunit 15-like n=1 Tax=Haliotis asinina TaxID=109174 RepID=UPI0035326C66
MALQMNSFVDTMLRQRVVAQIEAAREGAELGPETNSSEEMENVLYNSATSREQYMQLIATLVLHLNEKKRNAHRAAAQPGVTGESSGATASK